MTDYEHEVKTRLIEAINSSAVSLAELSRRTDIPYNTIQGYARGVQPTAARLGLICKVLGVSADWILRLTENNPRS